MEAECSCQNKALVRRQVAGGAVHYGHQCPVCGKWKSVPKATLSPGEMSAAGTFDDSISDRYWRERHVVLQRQRDNERRAESQRWWLAYGAYLNSDKWKERSQKVLERDNHICQACLIRKATQAHHLTYEHCQNAAGEFGYEPLFDLIAICKTCHDFHHKVEREKRGLANVGSN